MISLFKRIFTPGSPKRNLRKEINQKLESWVAQKGFREDVYTGELSRRLGIPENEIIAYCQSKSGLSFRSWRTWLRVQDAKDLIESNPDISSSAVATIVGFRDRSNFHRIFLRETGMTPREYKDSIR